MSDRLHLLDPPADEKGVTDAFSRVRDRLAQVPDGKTGALVIAVDWQGVLPTVRTGFAQRTANGWEIHGEAFISKAAKGASVRAVKTW